MQLRYPVVLASASPRRVGLLRSLVPEFEQMPADVAEDPRAGELPWETAERLAVEKARVVADQRGRSLVMAGDTVVALQLDVQWVQLAKPESPNDAARMLGLLSGREHWVITGIALVWPGREMVAHERTVVRFRSLSTAEIAEYVATGEPMDKAGAYAIQGGASGFVENVEGSLTNVIGLPMERLEQMLTKVS